MCSCGTNIPFNPIFIYSPYLIYNRQRIISFKDLEKEKEYYKEQKLRIKSYYIELHKLLDEINTLNSDEAYLSKLSLQKIKVEDKIDEARNDCHSA